MGITAARTGDGSAAIAATPALAPVPDPVPAGPLAEPGIDAAPARSIQELHDRLAHRSTAVRDALTGGTLVQDGVLSASGITGPPQKLRVMSDAVGEVGAISKSANGTYIHAEQFAAQLAERMGIGHLVAPVVERDGRIVIAMVPGVQAREAGMNSADDLEGALRTFYARRLSGVSADDIARQARIDRQLVQVFDHAIAIADRHGRNLLVDADLGAVTLIDHSELLLGHSAKRPHTPFMMRRFMGGTHSFAPTPVVRLDDDVRQLLRERLPAGSVDAMLDELRASAGSSFTRETAGRLADPAKAASIGARLETAVETGALRSRYLAVPEFLVEHGGNLLDDSAFLRRLVGFFRRA